MKTTNTLYVFQVTAALQVYQLHLQLTALNTAEKVCKHLESYTVSKSMVKSLL